MLAIFAVLNISSTFAKSCWCFTICLSNPFSNLGCISLTGPSNVGLPLVGTNFFARMSINFCGALLRTSLPPAFNKSPAKGIKPKADNPAMPRFMAPEPKSPEPKSR